MSLVRLFACLLPFYPYASSAALFFSSSNSCKVFDAINLLNTKLSKKDITNVSIIDTKVEILISVKT